MNLRRAVLFEQVAKNTRNIILEDEFLLIHTFKQLMAETVNRLALLVHHVVVFEQMLAGLEVLRFDCFLCFLDSASDQTRFDWDAFFHPQLLEQG